MGVPRPRLVCASLPSSAVGQLHRHVFAPLACLSSASGICPWGSRRFRGDRLRGVLQKEATTWGPHSPVEDNGSMIAGAQLLLHCSCTA